MQQPINYQPLAAMEEVDFDGRQLDLTKSPMTLFRSLRVRDRLLLIFTIFATIGLVAKIGALGFVLVLAGPVVILSSRLSNQQKKVWRQFAAANGWSIVDADFVDDFVPPTVAQAGHSHKNSEAINGTLNKAPFYVFKHEYTVGGGKDSTTYILTIITLKINANLPHIFLRSPKAVTSGNLSDLKEKLQLEGDFNKYFKVFVQPSSEVDDLTILTPDVMQFLITDDKVFNIETHNGYAYIIADKDCRRADKLPAVIDFSDKFYIQLMQNLPLAGLANPMPTSAAAPS